jgi:hypothetical protein
MNLREAAQQALEALEESIDTVRNEYESDWRHGVPTREKQLSAMRELVEKHEAAITALRAALAEFERKPLTDEEILSDEVLRYHFGCNGGAGPVSQKGVKIIRAVERAHGIGGKE